MDARRTGRRTRHAGAHCTQPGRRKGRRRGLCDPTAVAPPVTGWMLSPAHATGRWARANRGGPQS